MTEALVFDADLRSCVSTLKSLGAGSDDPMTSKLVQVKANGSGSALTLSRIVGPHAMDLKIDAKFEGKVFDPVLVPVDDLARSLQVVGSEAHRLRLEDSKLVIANASGARVDVVTVERDWPDVAWPKGASIELDASLLSALIDRVKACAAKDDSRYGCLSCIRLSWATRGNRTEVTAEAANGKTLARYRLDTESQGSEGAIYWPSKALGALSSFSGVVTLQSAEGAVIVRTENGRWRITGPAVATWPDTGGLLTDNGSDCIRASFQRDTLIEVVDAMRKLSSTKVENSGMLLQFDLKGENLSVLFEDSAVRAARSIDFKRAREVHLEGAEAVLDATLVSNALAATSGEIVTVRFGGEAPKGQKSLRADNPVTFEGAGGGIAVVMPIVK